MLDTSTWPVKKMNVLRDLHLDPENVRLDLADAKVEADILTDLFANENALGLVEGICKVGYLTHETPVVVKRGEQYVMAEGNRRLAALKVIQNPLLVPSFKSRVESLVELLPDRSALSSINVMFAPTQDDADRFVAILHTANLRRPWGPSRQAAFFRTQLESGRTFRELVQRYPLANVGKFVFQFRVVNMFESVPYEDPELHDFTTTKSWRKGLSTLARIYESRAFRDLLGLSMDADGKLSMTVTDDVFAQVAAVIVQGMLEGSINTRHLNSVESTRFKRLMSELAAIVNADESGSAATSSTPSAATTGHDIESDPTRTEEAASTGDRSSEPEPAGHAKRPRRPRHTFLDTSQIRVPDSYPLPFKHFIEELSVLDVQNHPNAGFMMLRAALEKGIKCFAEAKNVEIHDTHRDRNGFVQLGHCLDWLNDYIRDAKETRLIQVIDGVRSGKVQYYTLSKNKMNAVNHNHLVAVDGDEVVALWSSIEPLMRYLMKP